MRGPALERAAPGHVVLDGRELVYFGGCDYLGLAGHPRVVAALREGLELWGVSASASRQTSGDTLEHRALEEELARFLVVEACLLLPEGWLANVALLESLADEVDLALIDDEAHMSLSSAVRASGVSQVRFGHVDVQALASRLAERRPTRPCVLTDGLYPSQGHSAPLEGILDALPAQGLLIVDDCHGLGVLGARGRGTCEQLGIEDPRTILTGTLSKALGCYGGFVAGSAERIERIRVHSKALLGTTPVPPALAAAARVALGLLAKGVVLDALRRNLALMRGGLAGLRIELPAPLVPVVALQPQTSGRALHATLLDEGLLVPLVRYPGGPARGEESDWLRLAVSAAHTPQQIEHLTGVLRRHLGPPA